MNILLRIVTLILGLGLVIAPPLLMFGMAASMGELEEVDSLARLLAEPLLVGLLLGLALPSWGCPRWFLVPAGHSFAWLQVY